MNDRLDRPHEEFVDWPRLFPPLVHQDSMFEKVRRRTRTFLSLCFKSGHHEKLRFFSRKERLEHTTSFAILVIHTLIRRKHWVRTFSGKQNLYSGHCVEVYEAIFLLGRLIITVEVLCRQAGFRGGLISFAKIPQQRIALNQGCITPSPQQNVPLFCRYECSRSKCWRVQN